MTRRGNASFYGGVAATSDGEEQLAYLIGAVLARRGYVLQHGGYNGLMERAAEGAAAAGGEIVAVTLAGVEWGDFNPYVTDAVRVGSMGERLHQFLDDCRLVVAMGGGIGTLHELTAALWFSGNIRPVPILIAGPTAQRLVAFLRAERWLYESPTRPLGFLREVHGIADVERELDELDRARENTVGSR